MPLLHLDDAVVHELREGAADSFQFEPEVTANFFAGHAQDELRLGEPTRMQTLHQIEQEGGQPLFGAHAAEQEHHAVFTDDLPAHDLVHMVLQRRDFP